MTRTEKNREQKLRRAAIRAGYRLVKRKGGFRIIGLEHNALVAGENFNLDLDDVAEWLAHLAQ